jgi:hypothetical protein
MVGLWLHFGVIKCTVTVIPGISTAQQYRNANNSVTSQDLKLYYDGKVKKYGVGK